MQAARVPEQNYLRMMGKVSSVYSENRRSELFQVYNDAYEKLSIYTTENQTLSRFAKELTRLQKENTELRQRLNKITLSSDQVQELLGRIEQIEKKAQQKQT